MSWTVLETTKLREIDLFRGLSDVALEKVAAITYTRTFRRSEQIFADGDQGDAMYLIIEGEVRISKQIKGVGEEALAILKPGHYFGEMGLLDGLPTSAEAWANRRCVLKVLDRQELLKLMASDRVISVELLWAFSRTLSKRLFEMNNKVTFLAVASKF